MVPPVTLPPTGPSPTDWFFAQLIRGEPTPLAEWSEGV